MTETTVISGSPLFPTPKDVRYIVDPVAFTIAMVGGPILVGILGSPLLAPIFATALGGPLYLILGVPVMLYRLRITAGSPKSFAAAAFCTNAIVLAAVLLYRSLVATPELWKHYDLHVTFLAIGLIFAPLWGAVSGWIYTGLRKPFYASSHNI